MSLFLIKSTMSLMMLIKRLPMAIHSDNEIIRHHSFPIISRETATTSYNYNTN